MKLYGYWRSSSAYRMRIVLNLKGIDYAYIPVHLRNLEQRTDDFLARNPLGQVPVLELEHGGQTRFLTQSVAIQEYLEECFPDPRLLPEDPLARARVRQLVEVVNAGIQPLQNFRTLMRLKDHGVARTPWSQQVIEEGLVAFEDLAGDEAGSFCFGDSPTFADAFLVPQLYNARRFGVDVAGRFPLLAAIDGRCQELESFRAAHPDRQPDAESP
ncbi:MAG: maleylacetoacetate isomerase [Sandaracinaceae bacterium]